MVKIAQIVTKLIFNVPLLGYTIVLKLFRVSLINRGISASLGLN